MSSDGAIAWVEGFLHLVQGFLLAGLLFGLAFALIGVQRLDPAARQWPNPGFRLLLLPGMSVLWPLFVVRWWRGTPPPVERTAHRRAVGP